MSLARKVFSNTAWQILGKIVTAVLGIFSIKLITNYLTPGEYGEYTTVYDYTALFAIIADFGLFTIAVREMAHEGTKEMIQKIVGNILSIRTALAGSFLFIGIVIAFLIPAYRGTYIPLGVIAVSAATTVTLVGSTMSSVLQYHLRMSWASIALIVGKILTVGYIAITVWYLFPSNPDKGFYHLLFAWIIGGVVTLAITYTASKKSIPISFQFDFVFWKKVLIKALPYGLALVLGTIYFRMGTIALSLYKMREQAGFFGVPLRFLEILQIIPHYFMNSVLPILTIRLRNAEIEGASRIVKYATSALAGVAFPILVGGYFLAWPLTAAVSNAKFLTHFENGTLVYGSDVALKILLVAMMFTYLHVALSYVLVSIGKQIELLWINLLAVLINIVANILLIPSYGFIGAAISSVCAEIVMFTCLFWRVRVYVKNIWDVSFLAKSASSAALMGIALHFVAPYLNAQFQSYSLALSIPLGGAVFLGSMIALRAITPEMIAVFKKSPAPKGEVIE